MKWKIMEYRGLPEKINTQICHPQCAKARALYILKTYGCGPTKVRREDTAVIDFGGAVMTTWKREVLDLGSKRYVYCFSHHMFALKEALEGAREIVLSGRSYWMISSWPAFNHLLSSPDRQKIMKWADRLLEQEKLEQWKAKEDKCAT